MDTLVARSQHEDERENATAGVKKSTTDSPRTRRTRELFAGAETAKKKMPETTHEPVETYVDSQTQFEQLGRSLNRWKPLVSLAVELPWRLLAYLISKDNDIAPNSRSG